MRWIWLALAIALVAWAAASGRLARGVLSFQILDELRRPGQQSWLRRATPAPSFRGTTLEHGGLRVAADLYEPGASARGAAAPLLLIPGLVEQGKDEPRVRPFAELLARAGFRVVVPDLPSFRRLRIHPDHERELAAALDAVCARADLAPAGRAGIFGISYAGGVALLVALDPARARRVPLVAAAGAYADLDSVLRYLATGLVSARGRTRLTTPDPYGELVFARTFEEFLAEPRDRAALRAMVERRLRDPRAAIADLAQTLSPPARVLYDLLESATAEQVPELLRMLPDALVRRMEALSPARRSFAALRARLHLVHARDDGTFPVSEAYRLAELARPRVPVRLVVLESLQHVDPEPWRRDFWGFVSRDLPEGLRLAWWWYGVLGERR